MDAEARRRFGPSGFPLPVLLGVLPLQSTRHAEFLHNEVPGHHDPGRDPRRHARGRRARRGGRPGDEPGAAGAGRRPRGRDVRHAQLRALRAGGRARPPDPRRHEPGDGPIDRRDLAAPLGVDRPVYPARDASSRDPAVRRVPRPRRRRPRERREPAAGRPAVPRTPSTARPSTTTPASSGPTPSSTAERIIDAIEAQTKAEVVVYTQDTGRDEVTTDEADADAQALMDQWGVGRRGIDDGLVILYDLDSSGTARPGAALRRRRLRRVLPRRRTSARRSSTTPCCRRWPRGDFDGADARRPGQDRRGERSHRRRAWTRPRASRRPRTRRHPVRRSRTRRRTGRSTTTPASSRRTRS